MKTIVGRKDSRVLLRVDGVIGEEDFKMMGRHAGHVVLHLRLDPEEAKRIGMTMLDEANYCEEEMAS